MAPSKDSPTLAESLKKRKLDRTDLQNEERRNRKKQKSKRKSLGEQNGEQTDTPAAEAKAGASSGNQNYTAKEGQLVVKEGSNGQLEVINSSWNVSKPIGGRMLDIDPIFSEDEVHLILTYNTSIQVYTTADSLLVRRIQLPLLGSQSGNDNRPRAQHIVASVLSKASPNLVYVASSDGRVWCIDWMTGSGADSSIQLQAGRVWDMTVDSLQIGKTTEDVILVLQKTSHSVGQLTAYNRDALTTGEGKVIHTCSDYPRLVRSTNDASVVIVAAKDTVHVGYLKSKGKANHTIADREYQFFSFGIGDLITSIDIRCQLPGKKQQSPIDLAVGCARGPILLYYDVVSKSPLASSSTPRKGGSMQPRKHHWHRRAVHSVKWSQDGNYLISGGSENVLVLWQLDTGAKDYLPHLSASIENIVVSPRGSSYAVHLDDNSTMVLSTAELQPTTYISGVQSLVLSDSKSKESLVKRVWQPVEEISRSIPATSNPIRPAQILLPVGNGQQATLTDGSAVSAPYIQTFDIEASQSLSKLAVARTAPTEANITPSGHPIIEPTTTQLAYSYDGKWLATVDEWQPPERDVEALVDGSRTLAELCQERREIYLKFWEQDEETGALNLVTRVNEAHRTTHPETVFDVGSNPVVTQFATIGGDGIVRVWAPRLRKQDGLSTTGPEGQALWGWSCAQVINLGESALADDDVLGLGQAAMTGAIDYSEDGSILFVAYGSPASTLVYIIDTESGEIRDRIPDLFRGEIRGIKAVASCLVMLSDELTVYDIVSDELRYGLDLSERFGESTKLTQLAVNRRSRNFAVAVPLLGPGQKTAVKGTTSELAVFSIEQNKPQLVQPFPHLITSVLPAARSSGFVVIDSAAQVWSVTAGTEAATLAKPLEDLHLDKVPAQEADQQMEVDGEEEDEQDADEEMQDVGEDVDDYDVHAAVVAPQHLADIFNAGPSFAMPPIEDTFYQIAKLFSAKPSATTSP